MAAARSRSCADDHLREFHQSIKMLGTRNFESLQLSEFGKLRFDWLTYYRPLSDVHRIV